MTPSSLYPQEPDIRALYERILQAWNHRDGAAMAATFEDQGHMIGFDGSQVDGRRAIEAHLGPIFGNHPTATYVAKIRGVRPLAPTVAVLRAVAGMVPPGKDALNPALNTVHTLVATRQGSAWLASAFQSTPAAWHGRPQDTAALVEELSDVLRRGLTVR
jgi:uncharacterized protein (TIGR02246 family)